MMDISRQDKELLLDYCLGIAPQEEIPHVESLIASNPQAAQLHASFQASLSPLQTVESGPCPPEWVERTVTRIKEAAAQEKLEGLLAEQGRQKTIKLGWGRNFTQIAAIAAMLVFVVGIFIPSLGFARNIYLRNRCQMQLARIYDGLSSYSTDHQDRLPAVAMADGSPWWKVGYQGKENHSNTRPGWLLVRQGYVDPGRFICPSTKGEPRSAGFNPADYNDFPDKGYIRYSFRVCCDRAKANGGAPNILMADRNPLAEKLPVDFSKPFRLKLDRSILTANSANHRGSGQNVLRGDGAVQFVKSRWTGITKDDIFCTDTMTLGSDVMGCEKPCGERDAFLAP
jgi:hypothetical protein